MKIIRTIILFILAILAITASIFLAVDGNLTKLTGRYTYEPGATLLTKEDAARIADVRWMRFIDLDDELVCERDENGVWWITQPFRDRVAPEVPLKILAFTKNATIVDTLPWDKHTREHIRSYGVEAKPLKVTLKSADADDLDDLSTVARYTLGYTSPWLADASDGKTLMPTSYLRARHYGKDKSIHIVTGDIRPLFQNGLAALRDPYPLYVDPARIHTVSVLKAGATPLILQREESESASLQAAPEPRWQIISPGLMKTDSEKVENLIMDLVNLRAIKVQDKKEVKLPETPTTTITFHLTGAKEPLLLKMYEPFSQNKSEQRLCYATISDREVVFTLQVEPKVRRKHSYSSIVNAALRLPVLPEQTMAQLQSGNKTVYTEDLALDPAALRSMKFADVASRDIVRVSIRPGLTPDGMPQRGMQLMMIPGNAANEVEDIWMCASGYGRFQKAENPVVKRFLSSFSSLPVMECLADAKDDAHLRELVAYYGLDNPDYTIFMLPRPNEPRARLFGLDLPMLPDPEPLLFYLKRYRDPITGESMSLGLQAGTYTIYRLRPRMTGQLSMDIDSWRSLRLFDFPISAVRTLHFKDKLSTLSLNYDYVGEEWNGTLDGEDISLRINAHRAQHYIRQLQKLKAYRWVAPDDPEAIACLGNPAFTVQLDLEITDYSDAEAIVVDSQSGAQQSSTPGGGLMGLPGMAPAPDELGTTNPDLDAAFEQLAFAERKVRKETCTLELAPRYPEDERSPYYGRIVETGQIFILRYNEVVGLYVSMLD